jgi:hypothetical protein
LDLDLDLDLVLDQLGIKEVQDQVQDQVQVQVHVFSRFVFEQVRALARTHRVLLGEDYLR